MHGDALPPDELIEPFDLAIYLVIDQPLEEADGNESANETDYDPRGCCWWSVGITLFVVCVNSSAKEVLCDIRDDTRWNG